MSATPSSGTTMPPLRLAGIPLRSLAFGLRNWMAMVLALYVAFWLQLESASSAAVCVGILALPTRGQALQKAIYRLLGTAIGVVASFAIAGLFNEVRDFFVVAFAAWLGLCVFAAGFLDGNRAYGAVLSGYTVAIVAVAQIDSPQNVFDSGVNRGAAIVVGILAITFINDVFAAPDVFSGLTAKLAGIHGRVREFAARALHGENIAATEVAHLYAEIAALHPDITALPAERLAGRARAAAARIAVTAMVQQVTAARAVASMLDRMGEGTDRLRDALAAALDAGGTDRARAWQAGLDASASRQDTAQWAGLRLLDLTDTVAAAIGRVEAGIPGPAGPLLPTYRARQDAARNGMRTFLAVLLAAAALSVTGWPGVSLGLTFIGATLGIGGTNPRPRSFAAAAMMAMPLAVLIAGITEFLVLDGTDDFAALALAMAPPVFGASILLGSGKPKLVGLGFLIIVFFPVLLAPSNPQNYDPQDFLNTGVVAVTAVVAVFVLLSTLLPTTDAMRRRWILRAAQADYDALGQGHAGSGAAPADPASAAYRDATRLGQLGGLAPAAAPDGDAVRRTMRLMDLSAGLRTAARSGGMAPHPCTLKEAAMSALETTAGAGRDAACLAASDLLIAAALIGSWENPGAGQDP